jgi:hypothetical protein
LKESHVSLQVFGYVGQAIELRCVTNDTSKFNRISHHLANGTVQTLVSNEVLNDEYRNSELHIEKHEDIYLIRIDPIMQRSAGVYICEDDMSQSHVNGHATNITLHVISESCRGTCRLMSTQNQFRFQAYKTQQSMADMRFIQPFWIPSDLVVERKPVDIANRTS